MCLVMEYVPSTLLDHIKLLSWQNMFGYAMDIARGMNWLHCRYVISLRQLTKR